MTDRRSNKSDSFDDKLIAFVWKAQEDAAAIARVREASDGNQVIPAPDTDDHDAASYAAGYVTAMHRVRRALDGE